MKESDDGESGSATVEQAGLILLVSLLISATVTFLLVGGGDPAGRGLGQRIANRISCGPREPDACRHHPAVSAYGWPLARAIRFFAPETMARPGPEGRPLVPVDYRYCRHSSCAVPASGGDPVRLTTSNRRVTVFTEVRHLSDGSVDADIAEIVYWLYRPGLGWEGLHHRVGRADIEAASDTRVLLKDSPMLVPLETLYGRNHVDFADAETPPWQWRVKSIYRDHG